MLTSEFDPNIAIGVECVLLVCVAIICIVLIVLRLKTYINSTLLYCTVVVLGLISLATILLAGVLPSLPLSIFAEVFGAVGVFLAARFSTTNINARRIAEVAAAKTELAEQKNAMLVSQIKPHFVQNTLMTIAYLCEENPLLAQNLTLDFAEYLRGNIDSINGADLIPFSKELNHVKAYLAVERARFGDTFQIAYDIQESDFLVPPLSLQPLVENAFKHGISPLPEGGTIWISTERVGNRYHITVRDNGVGFDPEAEPNDSKCHVGVTNTRNRICRLLGGVLNVKTGIGCGTEVIIEIPIEQNKEQPS